MAGNVTYSRVREVTRVARPDTERQWLQAACELSMRQLERCVVAAGGRRGVRARAESRLSERDGVLVRGLGLPRHVWVLLEAAMNGARGLSPKRLTDVEALESVARAALAQQSWQRKCVAPDLAVDSPPTETQSGSWDGAGGEASGATQSGSEGAAGEALRTTQSGSWDGEAIAAWSETQRGPVEREHALGQTPQSRVVDGDAVGAAPQQVSGCTAVRTAEEREVTEDQRPALSSDAEQLLELIQGDRTWNAATLCAETGIAGPRLIKALTDLEVARRVYRDPMGFYEAAPNAPVREAS